MDAASILLAIVAAGQAAWVPERSVSPPPASGAEYDRYAQPPVAGSTAVAPPATSGSRNRGGVAPPPWTGTTSAPDWETASADAGPSFGRTPPPASRPTESGWTSIGSTVAPPPLLAPQLKSSTSTPRNAPANSGFSASSESSRQATPLTAGADSWATGWSDNTSPSPATISRSATDTTSRGATSGDLVPVQAATPRPQAQQPPPQTTNSWADLWGDNDPWADPPQMTPSAAPPQQAAASSAPSATTNPAPQPNPAATVTVKNTGTPAGSPGQAQPGAPVLAPTRAEPLAATTQQPPWLPLLVVSLSLAGSLGANLFLGWSYLDARQRYRTLVQKTADKFRRAAAACSGTV